MENHRLKSCIAGVLIGAFCGTFFYLIPAKLLILGPLKIDGLFIPSELNSMIIGTAVWNGGIVGTIIGLLGGLGAKPEMPRGHMSTSISCLSFLVCTVIAFVSFGGNLAYMKVWKIVVTFMYVFIGFIIAVPLGQFLGFIERIKED